jgi:hypothetical protein
LCGGQFFYPVSLPVVNILKISNVIAKWPLVELEQDNTLNEWMSDVLHRDMKTFDIGIARKVSRGEPMVLTPKITRPAYR